MDLPLNQFVDLLVRFESTPEPEEVRRTVRVMVRRQVSIVLESDGQKRELDLVLHDLSRGGVSLTHHEGMPKEKKFTLLLSAGGERLSIPCVVRNCQMIRQHMFRIGAEFESSPRKLDSTAR
jgi:hypothetical protein